MLWKVCRIYNLLLLLCYYITDNVLYIIWYLTGSRNYFMLMLISNFWPIWFKNSAFCGVMQNKMRTPWWLSCSDAVGRIRRRWHVDMTGTRQETRWWSPSMPRMPSLSIPMWRPTELWWVHGLFISLIGLCGARRGCGFNLKSQFHFDIWSVKVHE